ncbi:FRG domain-containing protein [Microbacterium galbinum]|uniref:FRG domain-containing protein n=1 Tax=Microbacterium galbinum TaxID=2851646 RepID=A0ABY4INY5_9MICO|nr:FRG domain-containing protein [Microbacterium galbinum]UPL14349.1 FRG domain-containing protein [Microbacterium galbinum]
MTDESPPWNPQSYFRAWERTIDSWASLEAELARVREISGNRKLVWRGVHKDSYGLLSSAYRRLRDQDNAVPTERRMVEFETRLLSQARTAWPDRGGSALEALAHIQHYGGPTRLIDVSHSEMVAAFFASEQKFHATTHHPVADADGRLFAFEADNKLVDLDSVWGTRDLPWVAGEAAIPGWETDLPFVWTPPKALNERITAQQGAFLVGGVPSLPHGQNSRYRMPGAWQKGDMKTMPVKDVREVTSVSMFLKSLSRRTNEGSEASYTLRIKASAKPEIRERLSSKFGLTHGSIYPDLFGLATYGANFAGMP